MGIISIANSNSNDHFLSLFSWLLDRRYQIRFYSSCQIFFYANASTFTSEQLVINAIQRVSLSLDRMRNESRTIGILTLVLEPTL